MNTPSASLKAALTQGTKHKESNVTIILFSSTDFSECYAQDQSVPQRPALKISKFPARIWILHREWHTFTEYWEYFVDSTFKHNFIFNLLWKFWNASKFLPDHTPSVISQKTVFLKFCSDLKYWLWTACCTDN